MDKIHPQNNEPCADTSNNNADDYIFVNLKDSQSSVADANRLDSLAQAMPLATQIFLQTILTASDFMTDTPLKLVDLGSGSGVISLKLAKQFQNLNKTYQIYGLDFDATKCELANNLPEKKSYNVQFLCTDILKSELPSEIFEINLAYSRMFLCHIDEPEQVLIRVRNALLPGGYFVIQESQADTGWKLAPSCPEFEQLQELFFKTVNLKADSRIGYKLPSMLENCGYKIITSQLISGDKICQDAPEESVRTFILESLLGIKQAAVDNGFIGSREFDERFAVLDTHFNQQKVKFSSANQRIILAQHEGDGLQTIAE